MDGWIKKWYIAYSGILFGHKEVKLAICNNVNGPWGIMLSEMSYREGQTLYDLTYRGNLKKQTNKNWVHRYREKVDGYQMQEVAGGVGVEMGEGGQNVQSSSYKSWGCKMYSIVTIVNNTTLYICC